MTTKDKIVKVKTLQEKILFFKKQGRKIIFTNGCFDLLHFGHISYLEKSKKPGSILVVAINSDLSVRKIKAKDRPIQMQIARARCIAALECVDYVVLFNQETPYEIIKAIKPDLLVKGSDWKNKGVVGSDIIKTYGGKILLVDHVSGFSTTSIIQKIQKNAFHGKR